MNRFAAVLLAAGTLLPVAGPAIGQAAPGDPPQSCQGAFVTRGSCVMVTEPGYGPVTYSISGTAYGATDVAITVRLEDALSGRTLASCSAGKTGQPVSEVSCQRTVTLQAAPVVGRCVAEGLIAGRFFCDAI